MLPYKSIFHVRENHNERRIQLLDFLRGAGMLLVVLHHSEIPYGQWILVFHMPLLFLLSGYTIHLIPHTAHFSDFLRSRFLRLIVPYFLFEGVNLLVWAGSLFLQGGWQDVTDAVTAILSCLNTEGYTGYYGRLWFWPCMFVSDILFYTILRISPRKQKLRSLFLFAMIPVLFGISWVTSKILPGRLPFTTDTAFMAAAFLLTGYLLGPQFTWIIRQKHLIADVLILLLSLLAMRWSMLSGQAEFYMFINRYGHYGYSICAAYSGILAFLILTKWLYIICSSMNSIKSLVLWYGYHSLCTFPVHLSVKMFIYQMFPLSFRRWYILLPAMLLLNIPLVNLITKFFPFMLGKFPFIRQKSHAHKEL